MADELGEQSDLIKIVAGIPDVFQKEEKVDIIHIGICTVLSQFGYYRFTGKDEDGWPHFKNIKKINTIQIISNCRTNRKQINICFKTRINN